MKTETRTRPAEQIASFHADAQTTHPAVVEQRPRSHRRQGMLQKAARFITGRSRANRSADNPAVRTAVATVAQLPPLAEDIRQPIAPRLQYGRTEPHTMRPHGTGEDNNYRLGGTDLAPATHQPLLNKEQVSAQLGPGFDIGSLQAVIHLPGAKEPLYLFNQSTARPSGDITPRFMFATPTQLGKIRTHIDIGQPSADEISGEILTIERAQHSQLSDARATIGTERWLPGRPQDRDTRADTPVPEQYANVADRQLIARIDQDGVLMLRDVDPKYPTIIETNPDLIVPQDPWPNGPNYNEAMVL
jgi:hypothetical protein